jgi:hypothetical protein
MGFEGEKQSAKGMHRCPNCDSILMQPVDWRELGDGNWKVELRCPECERRHRQSYSQDEVDRYEAELDRGDQQLIGDLRVISLANMETEVDRFTSALATDRILPEDFHAGGDAA